MPADSAVELAREPLVERARRAQRVAGGVGRARGRAEHAQRGVALELVDPAAVLLDHLDDEREEAVQQRRPPRAAGGARPGRVEPITSTNTHGDLAQLAAELDLAVALERGLRHLAADVAPEQVAQPLALRAARPPCELKPASSRPTSLPSSTGTRDVELALLDPAPSPARTARDRLGDRARRDRDREQPDAAGRARPGRRSRRPAAPGPRRRSAMPARGDHRMPSSGTPVPSDHAIVSRPATPGPQPARRRSRRRARAP